MTDYLYESVGGLPIPPKLTTGAVTATELDPARAVLSGLFRQVLISELGAAWTQVVTALGSDHRLYGTSPVEDVLELRPTEQVLQARKQALPLLAVHRVGRMTFEDHTLKDDKGIQSWRILWFIGQASVEEQRRLGDFPQAAAKQILRAIRRRGHPDYESGALQFFPTTGAIGAVKSDWAETEPVQFKDSEMTWLMMEMAITTTEYGKWDDGAFVNADYMTLDMGVGDSTGIVPSFISADSRYPEGDPRP